MKLIIGLGNPGPEYNFTRHNFGFLALDFYAKVKDFTWEKEKHHAIWAKYGDNIFIKPQTFYNDSGLAVSEFLRFYKLTPADIIVINDDFDLNFGTLRYRERGSSGGNNGLGSITEHLGTSDFQRLRLGTNNPELRAHMGDIKFVLSRFSAEEKAQLPDFLHSVTKKLDSLL